MSDPNRIIERIEKLLLLAGNALDEARTIYEGAIDDEEDEEVLAEAERLFRNFEESDS